jgi:uncharacterized protein (TIGR02145 family)
VKSSGIEVYRCQITVTSVDYQLDIALSEPMILVDPRDGHIYNARKIGNHIWFTENLVYLPMVSPPGLGSDSQGFYYVYDYQGIDLALAKASENYTTYGVLYNWTAAGTACPDGWHLPGDDEWKNMETYLGMEP